MRQFRIFYLAAAVELTELSVDCNINQDKYTGDQCYGMPSGQYL